MNNPLVLVCLLWCEVQSLASMPLTPRFTLQQSEDFVEIVIRVPHIRVTNSEFHIDGKDFTFYCKPYFLKLTLPHEIYDDDDTCKAVYNPDEDKGVIRVTIPKKEPGLHFPDLDLQTHLLQMRVEKDQKEHVFPSIEIVGEETFANEDEDGDEKDSDKKEEISDIAISTSSKCYYGFNSKYTRVLHNLGEEIAEMTNLGDPDNITLADRQLLRRQSEEADFNADRYLGDLHCGEEDYLYKAAMSHSTQWDQQWIMWKDAKKTQPKFEEGDESNLLDNDAAIRIDVFQRSGGFSEVENDTMRTLPNKKYLIPRQSREERLLMLGLVDILFAYCYDHRLTEGDPTVSFLLEVCCCK